MEAPFLKYMNYEDPTTKLGLANIYHTQLQSIVIRIDFSDKKFSSRISALISAETHLMIILKNVVHCAVAKAGLVIGRKRAISTILKSTISMRLLILEKLKQLELGRNI